MCMKLFGNQYEKDQYTKWNQPLRGFRRQWQYQRSWCLVTLIIQPHEMRWLFSLQFPFLPGNNKYSSQQTKNITEKMPSQRQRDTWGGGGIMLWHNNAIGYICPGVPECSTSLLILSTEEVSKGAWPPYISIEEFNDITKNGNKGDNKSYKKNSKYIYMN